MGNTRSQKNKGSQIFRRKLSGTKSISKFDQIFEQNGKNKGSQNFSEKSKGSQINFKVCSIFFSKVPLKFEGLIYCSKTPAATSLYNNDAQI